MKQASDFLKDSRSLYDLMFEKDIGDFKKSTQFKNWTVSDVFGHLYVFNIAAIRTLQSSSDFDEFYNPISTRLLQGQNLLQAQGDLLDGCDELRIFEIWWASCQEVYEKYSKVDAKLRVKWAGPEMSARSSITARQMETWAHGHEVFDCFGVIRKEKDHIKNIVHLGVATFGWTFANRNLPIPSQIPYISLILPSGDLMIYNEADNSNFVKGCAVEFCQVVTQTRNIMDTKLKVNGETAQVWMNLAQCFAGKPENPPHKGQRYRKDY